MATNWLQDAGAADLWNQPGGGVNPSDSVIPWWTVPAVGAATPQAYGQRLGSYRLQNQAQQRLLRDQALAALQQGQNQPQSAQSGAGYSAAQSLQSNIGNAGQGAAVGINPTAPSLTPPEPAPSWLTGAAGPGTWLRELIRPGKSLFERGGSLLGGAAQVLGSLVQGAESTVGLGTGQLPALGGSAGKMISEGFRNANLGDLLMGSTGAANVVQRVLDNPDIMAQVKQAQQQEGVLSLRPSAAAAAQQQGQEWQQYFPGQDFTQKYREQTPALMKSLTDPNSPVEFAYGQASNIAYSGAATNDARQRAQQRILSGEDPTVVMRGMAKPGINAYGDEVAQYNEKAQEYMAGQGRIAQMAALKQGADPAKAAQIGQEAAQEAGRWVAGTGRIPGEEVPIAELIGQSLLDPLNLPGANQAIEALTKPVVTKALGVEKAAQTARTVWTDAMGAELKAYQTGIGPTDQKLIGKVAGMGDLGQQLAKYWEKLRAYTPVTQAKQLAGTAFTQLGAMINDAPTGADALQVVERFAKDPDSLMAMFGATPKNLYSEAARPVVADALEQVKKLPSVTAAEFNPVQFLAEAMPAFEDAARKLVGAPAKGIKETGLLATLNTAKQWMSEFYLKTPGYIIRNYLSDNAIATMDGLNMFDDMKTVRNRLDKFGATTARVQNAGDVVNAASDVLGRESKLAQIPIVKEIKPLVAYQTKIGQIASKAEEARYIRAYDSALQQFRATNWAPKLSDATRQLFENAGMGHIADAIEAGWRQSMSAKDLRKVTGEVLNAAHPAEQFFVTKYGIDPLDISPEMATTLERTARDIAKRGGTAEEFGQAVDALIEQARQKAASGLTDLGVITKPRATTQADALQDIADEVRQAEASLARAVNHGEITQGEAAKLLADHKAGLLQQAQERQTAVQALHDALGNVSPDSAEHVLSAALHPVDLEHELRDTARQQVDKLWVAEKRKPTNERDWATYFDARRRIWGEAGSKTVDGYKQATQAVQELRTLTPPSPVTPGATGEGAGAAEEILRKYGITGLTDKADQLLAKTRERMFQVDLMAPEYRNVPVAERAGAEQGIQQFWDQQLKPQRVQWDEARNEARRYLVQMVRANPGMAQDGMDVWIASQRAVDVRFTQAAGRQEAWIQQMLGGDISYEEYRALSSKEWGSAFDFAISHNGEQTVARIKSLELRRGIVAQKLQQLGYQGDELKRLVSGFTDGSTRDETANIIQNNVYAAKRVAPEAVGGVDRGKTALDQALKPPASADEYLAANGGDAQAALEQARRMQEQAGGLVDFGMRDARGEAMGQIPTLGEVQKYLKPDGSLKEGINESNLTELADRFNFVPNDQIPGGEYESIRQWLEQARGVRQGARAQPGKAAANAAEDAYAKWGEIVQELEGRAQHAAGLSAAETAQREFVRNTIDEQGLAQGADTVRQLFGDSPEGKPMMDELAQVAKEQAQNILEGSDSVEQGMRGAEQVLADALFGTRNETELGGVTAHMADTAGTARALEQFRQSKGIPNVPGLETERSVATIRALAGELGLNPDDFVKGERSINDVVHAAQQANPELAGKVLSAPTIADGRIEAKAWADLGLEGERRKPGDVLKALAPTQPSPAKAGEGVAAITAESLAQKAQGAKSFDELKAALGSDANVMKWGDPTGVYVGVSNRKAGINVEGRGSTVSEAVADAKAKLGIKPSPQPSPGHQGVPGEGIGAPTSEQLSAVDAAVEQAGGSAEPLGMEDMLAAAEKKQIAALQKARDGMTADWGRLADPAGLPKEAWKNVEADLRKVMPQWYEFRNAATYAAKARADFSMLDYSLKRGGDVYAAAVAPYYYWGSRQARNFAIRLMARPQNIVALNRYQTAMKKQAQQQGLRARFEGMWQVPGIDGMYVDPTALLFPFANMIQTDTSSPTDSRSAMANIYQAMSQIGFRPGPWIDIPLRASNLLVGGTPGTADYASEEAAFGKGSIGSFIPQTGLIKGATALAGVGTPGGIDIEQPVRRALGLPESQPFEPYIVARAVRDIATERQIGQGQQLPYLLAQALITNASDPTSGYGWSQLLGGQVTPQMVAQQFATSGNDAQAALQIVRDAADRAGKQKGVSALASGMLGQRVAMLPQGEQQYVQLQQAERAGAYNPATGTGSAADLQAVRQANPALAVGRAQYGTIPGETTNPTAIYQSAQRDVVNQAFDGLKDAVIQTQPWNRDAGFAVEDARKAALDTLATSGTAQGGGWQAEYQKAINALNGQASTTPTTYKPRSLYGTNPSEAAQVRKDEALKFISATRPKLADFTTNGTIPDYAAYQAATAEWEKQLPQIAASNPLVEQVAQQAEADGYGAQVRQLLTGISMQDIQSYWQRNDTPLEAAQRSYFSEVYDPAMQKAKSGSKVVITRLPDVGAMDTAGLIKLVQQDYPGRWNAAELAQQLKGMSMPPLREVAMEQMTPAARQTAQRQQAFMDTVKQKYGARGVDAVTAYDNAAGADAKAAVRKRYSVLARILPERSQFLSQ